MIPVKERTDETLEENVIFAARLRKDCHGTLPKHLQKEYDEVVAEQIRRKTNIDGDGI